MKIANKQYTRAQRRSIDSSGEVLRGLLKEYLQTLRNRYITRMHKRDVYVALNRRWQGCAGLKTEKRMRSVGLMLLRKYWWMPVGALLAGVATGWVLRT